MNKRLIAGLVGALLLLTMPAAMAQDAFVGTSTSTGLELTVDGEGVVIGFSEAAVQSAPDEEACGSDRGSACARGAGELLSGTVAEAHAPGNEGPDEATGAELPEALEPLLTAELGIGRAEADSNGMLWAQGEGGAATADVNVTQTLFEDGEEVFGPVQDGLQDVIDTVLSPIAEEDPTGTAALVEGALQLLVDNLDDAPLATIAVSPTASQASDDGNVTSASATAQGARILVAPFVEDVPELPEALIIIEVSEANASVTSDRLSAEADADPAIVRVQFFNAETGEFEVIEIAPGTEAVTIAEGTPLETTIFPAGSATEVSDTGASARAAGVRIEALADPAPQLIMSLSYAEAAVNAEAVEPPPQQEEPEPEPDLPRTGTNVATGGLLLLGLGAAGWYGTRRLRTTA